MRMVLSAQDFKNSLALLTKASARNTGIGPFGWLKLKTESKNMVLQSANGEVYLTLTLQTLETKEHGEVCVELLPLYESIRSTSDEYVELYTTRDKLVVKTDRLTQKFDLRPVEMFPVFPKPEDFQASIRASMLSEGIKKTGFAVKKDRSVMGHLYVDFRGDRIHFVGTDGHRLAMLKFDYTFDPSSAKVKLYHKSLKILKELLRKDSEVILIGCGESKLDRITNKKSRLVYITNGDWMIAIRDFSAESYPNYEAVIPHADTYDITAEIRIDDLDNALKHFTKADRITLEFTDSRFKIKSHDREAVIEASYIHGNLGFSIDFNPLQLKEFTEAARKDGYVIKAFFKNDEEVPALFKVNNDYLYLVMPLRRR